MNKIGLIAAGFTLLLITKVMAIPYTVTVSGVTSSLTYTGSDLTGISIEATVIPNENWTIPSVTFWARNTDTWESWSALSDINRETFVAEDLGNNRYRMQANDLGFMGYWPTYDTTGGYNTEYQYRSLNDVAIPYGFWIGYDDSDTPYNFPYYAVLANHTYFAQEYPLPGNIYPESPTHPDWAFGQNYGPNPVPEPATMFLLGSLASGLFGFAGLRKRFKK